MSERKKILNITIAGNVMQSGYDMTVADFYTAFFPPSQSTYTEKMHYTNLKVIQVLVETHSFSFKPGFSRNK